MTSSVPPRPFRVSATSVRSRSRPSSGTCRRCGRRKVVAVGVAPQQIPRAEERVALLRSREDLRVRRAGVEVTIETLRRQKTDAAEQLAGLARVAADEMSFGIEWMRVGVEALHRKRSSRPSSGPRRMGIQAPAPADLAVAGRRAAGCPRWRRRTRRCGGRRTRLEFGPDIGPQAVAEHGAQAVAPARPGSSADGGDCSRSTEFAHVEPHRGLDPPARVTNARARAGEREQHSAARPRNRRPGPRSDATGAAMMPRASATSRRPAAPPRPAGSGGAGCARPWAGPSCRS